MTFPRDPLPKPDPNEGRAEAEPAIDPEIALPERPVNASRATEADLFGTEAVTSPAATLATPVDWATPDTDWDGGGRFAALDAAESYEQEPGAAGRRLRHVLWEVTQTLVLALLIFFLVRTVAQNFRVEGPSMEPGLHNGQYLLVNKAVYFKLNLGKLSNFIPFIGAEDGEEAFLFHGPQRGDVIVFRYPKDPGRDFIKRVIGVPGDTVRIEDGIVYVNGSPLEESYISDVSRLPLEEQVVPPKSYFVLGDNRPNSSDSRSWGFVPEENIIGKAMFSYWPLSEMGGVGNRQLDLGVIKLPLP